MRIKGKIKVWNNEKGYGFIESVPGRKDVFFHINSLINKKREPEIGQMVTYKLTADKQGRSCAGNVALPGDSISKSKKCSGILSVFVIPVVFLSAVGLGVSANKLPDLVIALYILASLTTFALYAWDKSAARKGNWRTPEAKLHFMSLIGGWPGALVAQNLLRHKSKKKSFRFTFWVTVIINCGALTWIMSPDGAKIINSLIDRVV